IDFRTEKIIGALDFITAIIEYNKIIPTNDYTQRIINLNKLFIPNVYRELENQNNELKNANENYGEFMIKHNVIIEKQEFFNKEKLRLKNDFKTHCEHEHLKFLEILTKSIEEQKHHIHKIKMHTDNSDKLTEYINKYKQLIN